MNISIAAEPLFHIGSFPVTNTLVVTLGISLIIIIALIYTENQDQSCSQGLSKYC